MEFGRIEQSIFIAAPPAVVYDIVSTPEHMASWYADAAFDPAPGAEGRFEFGDAGQRVAVPVTIVEAVPGERFSFRWMAPPAPELPPVGTTLHPGNSLLVTFELTASGDGTVLTVSESGMREQGWEAAVLEHYYNDHAEGWAALLDGLVAYLRTLSAR